MGKLSKQDKVEIYKRSMLGEKIPRLSLEFGVNQSTIRYLVRLISFHGLQVLDNGVNRRYSRELKAQIIDEIVVQSKSVHSVAIEYALPGKGMLSDWLRQYYRKNGATVKKRRGRKPDMKKTTKPYEEMTDAEKIIYLEKKNYYLEAENEYLKKLDALIQQKKQQKQKKK